jgi:hypothetical protein
MHPMSFFCSLLEHTRTVENFSFDVFNENLNYTRMNSTNDETDVWVRCKFTKLWGENSVKIHN